MQPAVKALGFFLAAAATFGTATSCAAVQDTPSAEVLARKVVEEYCKLDFDGARLSSATWPKVSSLIAWEEDPGWDSETIVATYRLERPVSVGDEVHIPVTFEVVATFQGDGPLQIVNRRETVEHVLRRQSDRWVIVGPKHPPYVSVVAAIGDLRELHNEEPAGTPRKKNFRDALSWLESQQTKDRAPRGE